MKEVFFTIVNFFKLKFLICHYIWCSFLEVEIDLFQHYIFVVAIFEIYNGEV